MWKQWLIVGHRFPYLAGNFYDSLSCRPKPVESIRLKDVLASGVMVGCRVDGVEVDLGDGKHNIHHIPYTNTQHTSTLQG